MTREKKATARGEWRGAKVLFIVLAGSRQLAAGWEWPGRTETSPGGWSGAVVSDVNEPGAKA
jgi:hypothetical protein